MARKRSSGLLTMLAEAQQQRHRQQVAQQRAQNAEYSRQLKAYRSAQRAATTRQKEVVAEHLRRREDEAARLTAECEHRIAELRGILAAGAGQPQFRLEAMRTTREEAAFAPGALARPVPMPDPARYQVPPLNRLQSFISATRSEHEQRVAQARQRYEQDWQAARAAEADRHRRLADFRRQHLAWSQAEQRRVDAHNAEIEALSRRLRADDPAAVAEFFAAALYAVAGWPAGFPRRVTAAWDPAARQLVVDWLLPEFDIVPEVSRVRFVKSSDEYKRIALPAAQRVALYREVMAQSCLRVVADVFRADHLGQLDSVAFNGFARGTDTATGQEAERCLITAMITRADLRGVQLTQVEAVDCVTALRAQMSRRPERLAPVRPGRRPESVTGVAAPPQEDEDADVDLHEMDPERFEQLVEELFRARGLHVMHVGGAGDGGVDVSAEDPDPLTGGLIVIQVKRYRNTVPPSAVRDLYGVVQHRGATKGILVATSGFGPGSHEFAQGKPLTLIGGVELVDLLSRHGLPGRISGSASAG